MNDSFDQSDEPDERDKDEIEGLPVDAYLENGDLALGSDAIQEFGALLKTEFQVDSPSALTTEQYPKVIEKLTV